MLLLLNKSDVFSFRKTHFSVILNKYNSINLNMSLKNILTYYIEVTIGHNICDYFQLSCLWVEQKNVT